MRKAQWTSLHVPTHICWFKPTNPPVMISINSRESISAKRAHKWTPAGNRWGMQPWNTDIERLLKLTCFCKLWLGYSTTSELFAHRNAKHRIIYSCQLNDAVFNPIFSFRDVIFNLYGEYDNETRATFLGLWQAIGPLLTPHTEPMLANSVCIRPMAASIDKTRGMT